MDITDNNAVVDLSLSVKSSAPAASGNSNDGDVEMPMNLEIQQFSQNLETGDSGLELKNVRGSVRNIINMKCSEDRKTRRSLRPRVDRCYAESPDDPRVNGSINGNVLDNTENVIATLPIKELTIEELQERELKFKKFQEELRLEEIKLILLKKLKQSQHLKENLTAVPKPVSKTPTLPTNNQAMFPQRLSKLPPQLLKGQPAPNRSAAIHAPPNILLPPMTNRNTTSSTGLQANMMTSHPPQARGRNSTGVSNLPIYHAPADRTERSTKDPSTIQQETQREDIQTTSQKQAAAKAALRKQLEKTLLQIPPPKPPPPEMHFVPSPSNAEFIYLVGLEHVVDYITKEAVIPPPCDPFECVQCKTDFTPVWKWERGINKNKTENIQSQHATFQRSLSSRNSRVICEHCVTTNVKKALKAEHTNRLKTAFVKALKQEKEIDEKLANASSTTVEPPLPKSFNKPAVTIRKEVPSHTPQQQMNIQAQSSSTLPVKHTEHPFMKLTESNKFGSHHAVTAAALQQQLFRELAKNSSLSNLTSHQALPAHVMPPFNPILYPYQLAMAQAAGSKGLMEIQRQTAELQRQYLLDMIPSQSSQIQNNANISRGHSHNWKS